MKSKSIPSPAYVYKSATHWRMRAEEMRALAEEARDPMVRVMMLGIAADYDSFAESADAGAIGGSIMFRLAEMPSEPQRVHLRASLPDWKAACRFPDEGAPRSSGFNRASERRPALSGGADPLDDDIPF